MYQTSLIQDTLIVQDGESFIVYSPFQGIITRVADFPKESSRTYQDLQKGGFFNNPPDTTKSNVIQRQIGFRSLTLLLTRRCNLSCVYCYGAAKPTGPSMANNLAINALDWFVNQLSGETIRVTFHGGGEPTLEDNLIKTAVARAKEIRNGRFLRFHIVTNGTASAEFMEWMMSENFGISISMDGPPEIQNRNRPFVTGYGSSTVVEKTVYHLVNRKYPFTVRLTFSPADDIEKIVDYFGKIGVRSLHLEPLFPHGREYQTVVFGKEKSLHEVYAPEGKELVIPFLKALDVTRRHGIRITNGHLSNFTNGIGYFCSAASGRSMIVTHDGFLSGCLEVVDTKDKNFNDFFLGRYLPNERQFEIEEAQLAKMKLRHADILPKCKNCYARYTCAGGCAIKAVRATGNFFDRDLPYCYFTKTLVPIIVKRIAEMSAI